MTPTGELAEVMALELPTHQQRAALRAYVEEQARRRRRERGAMAVLFGIGWAGAIPPRWLVAPLVGRAILDDVEVPQ